MLFFGAFGIVCALLGLFAFVPVEQAVRKIAQAKFASFVRLFDRRAASESCGLAILRGTFVGLALLGIETLLIWVGTNHLGVRLDSFVHVTHHAWFAEKAWSGGQMLLKALAESLGISLIVIAFTASLVARFVHRRWLAVLVAASLAAASGLHFTMGAVQPNYLKVALLLVDCLVLVWVFNRFDLLTVIAAIFTFAFWCGNYPMLVILEHTGATGEWIAFGVWGAVVAGAAAIVFQSSLRTAYRRVATAFE